jgi:plastocyanin
LRAALLLLVMTVVLLPALRRDRRAAEAVDASCAAERTHAVQRTHAAEAALAHHAHRTQSTETAAAQKAARKGRSHRRNGFMIPRILMLALPVIALLFARAPAFADGGSFVTIKNFDYSPMNLAVAAGTTVTWKNLDGEIRTVVSVDGTFRSQALDQNDTFSFKFNKPGTYNRQRHIKA